MAIEISMDTPAIERLIGDDTELRANLRRGVVHNIIRRSVEKDLGGDTRKLVSQAALEVTREMRSQAIALLQEDTRIVAAIESQFSQSLAEAIRQGTSKARQGIDPAMLSGIESRLRILVDEGLAQNSARIEAMVSARIEKSLEAMLSNLEKNWMAEVTRHIRADVAAKLASALAE